MILSGFISDNERNPVGDNGYYTACQSGIRIQDGCTGLETALTDLLYHPSSIPNEKSRLQHWYRRFSFSVGNWSASPKEINGKIEKWSVEALGNNRFRYPRACRCPRDVFGHSDTRLPLPLLYGLKNRDFSSNRPESGIWFSGFLMWISCFHCVCCCLAH